MFTPILNAIALALAGQNGITLKLGQTDFFALEKDLKSSFESILWRLAFNFAS